MIKFKFILHLFTLDMVYFKYYLHRFFLFYLILRHFVTLPLRVVYKKLTYLHIEVQYLDMEKAGVQD